MATELFRAVLPVHDLGRGDAFWSKLLDLEVDPSVPMRHYIRTGGAILTLVDTAGHARGHGLPEEPFRPNPEILYFAVSDLDATWERAQKLRMRPLADDPDVGEGIQTHPWGERSFYGLDPSGNPISFVDDQTLYRGRG